MHIKRPLMHIRDSHTIVPCPIKPFMPSSIPIVLQVIHFIPGHSVVQTFTKSKLKLLKF